MAVGHRRLRQRVGAEAGVEQIADVQDRVLDAVAAQGAVEEQNEERGQDAQPTDPFESLAQSLIGADDTLAGLAAQRQLTHHDDEAAEDCQNQIDDEECKAARGAHFIGETPDVAQADCRADRRHQETKVGSKAFSFFHVFSPYNFFPLTCPVSSVPPTQTTHTKEFPAGHIEVYSFPHFPAISNIYKNLTFLSPLLTFS